MKRLIILLLTFTSLTAGFVLAEPKLDIDYKDYEFGWVPHNSTGVHYCVIRSVGSDTLVINDIVSSSVDLVMPLEQQYLAPGDTVIIPAVWNFKDTPNRATAFCRVYTNEQSSLDGKPLLLKFNGIVIVNPDSLRPVAVKPYRLEFSRMGKVEIDSIQFTLTNRSIRNLELTVAAYPFKECDISIPDSIPANSTATGWVKIKPQYVDQDFLTSMTIRMTDDTRFDRSITIPIRRKSYNQ